MEFFRIFGFRGVLGTLPGKRDRKCWFRDLSAEVQKEKGGEEKREIIEIRKGKVLQAVLDYKTKTVKNLARPNPIAGEQQTWQFQLGNRSLKSMCHRTISLQCLTSIWGRHVGFSKLLGIWDPKHCKTRESAQMTKRHCFTHTEFPQNTQDSP